MSKEMLEAFRILEEEKHINKDDIIDAVKESLKSAYKRRYGQSESCVIEFDDKKGDFKVYTVREVVEEYQQLAKQPAVVEADDEERLFVGGLQCLS